MTEVQPVVIVGGGPTGVMLAAELERSAWVAQGRAVGLEEALARWFGPPT